MPTPLVFVDSEWTSLDRDTRFPWEIAMVRRDPEPDRPDTRLLIHVDVESGYWTSYPPLKFADPDSLKISGFHERYGVQPPLGEVPYVRASTLDAGRLVDFWTQGATLVGACPAGDEETLWKLVRHAHLTPTWHYQTVDVETLAAGALGMEPPWDYDTILGRFGLAYDEGQRHTALGDALMARDLYDAVMRYTQSPDLNRCVDAPRLGEAEL